MFEEGLGQNKVLCSSSTESNCQWSTTIQASRRSPRQGDRSPATCRLLALENCTDSDSSLLPHLARFLARPVGRARFRFVGSWIVGLAIGGAKSRGADVAVGFSGWSLWKVLTIFRRCMTAEEGFQVFSSSG